jgi:hypothetical protein
MEEASILLHKRDTKLLCSLKHRHVVLASSRGGNILGSRPASAVNIVSKGELINVVSMGCILIG